MQEDHNLKVCFLKVSVAQLLYVYKVQLKTAKIKYSSYSTIQNYGALIKCLSTIIDEMLITLFWFGRQSPHNCKPNSLSRTSITIYIPSPSNSHSPSSHPNNTRTITSIISPRQVSTSSFKRLFAVHKNVKAQSAFKGCLLKVETLKKYFIAQSNS